MSKTQMWEYYPFPEVYAFKTDDEAVAYVTKRTKGHEAFEPSGKSATTQRFENGREFFVVVSFSVEDDADAFSRYGLLAHECCHVADAWMSMMGERFPGDEVYAYAVQSAFIACAEQLGEEWFKTP